MAIALPGCGGADHDEPEGETPIGGAIRDSAGIPIVENRAPAPGSRLGWMVGDEPAVTIGIRDASLGR